jgi:hypothetical protein
MTGGTIVRQQMQHKDQLKFQRRVCNLLHLLQEMNQKGLSIWNGLPPLKLMNQKALRMIWNSVSFLGGMSYFLVSFVAAALTCYRVISEHTDSIKGHTR